MGAGMLAAAVCGEGFASPTVNAVLSAIKAVTGSKGMWGTLVCRFGPVVS